MSAGRKLELMQGQQVPTNVTFHMVKNESWSKRTAEEIFSGKTVVVFSLPGAFTPTCTSSHVPRYNELQPVFRANGVDEVICISVNDPFVMDAWQHSLRASNITFLPDGNGEFTSGMGMLVDKEQLGFGKRSWRYSMLVQDCKVIKQFIEPDEAGDPFYVSDAETMLQFINIDAEVIPDIVMFTRPGCAYCATAKQLLAERELPYEEVPLTSTVSKRTLRALCKRESTPQIFANGKHVGGLEDLNAYLSQEKPKEK